MLSELKIGLAIAGAVVTLSSCTVANHYRQDRDEWQDASRKWQGAWTTQKTAYDLSEKNRKAEYRRGVDSLQAARNACAADLDEVRKTEAAKRRIHAKPVTFDAKGCPDRTLVMATEWAK